MKFVTETIAIGNSSDAIAPGDGIKAILNVAFDLDVSGEGHPKYQRHKVGLIDGPGNSKFKMMSAVLCLLSLLDEDHRQKILVHCHSGHSRSPSVVAVVLALAQGISVHKAYDYIKALKPDIVPHQALIQDAEYAEACLRQVYGKTVGMVDPIPLTMLPVLGARV